MSLQRELIRTVQNEILLTPPASVNESVQFLKTLMTIVTSYISYKRKFFSNNDYAKRLVYGVPVYAVKNLSHQSQIFNNWLTSVMDSIEKQFLNKLIISIETDNVLVEEYSILFKYKSDEDTLCDNTNLSEDFNKRKEVQKSVKKTLKNIKEFTDNLEDLPKSYFISIQLHYYDEITPANYQPTFFREFTEETKFEEEMGSLKLGTIITKYSSAHLKAKSIFVKPLTLSDDLEDQPQKKKWRE